MTKFSGSYTHLKKQSRVSVHMSFKTEIEFMYVLLVFNLQNLGNLYNQLKMVPFEQRIFII